MCCPQEGQKGGGGGGHGSMSPGALSLASLKIRFSGFWKLLDFNLVQVCSLSLCLHLPHSRPVKATSPAQDTM